MENIRTGFEHLLGLLPAKTGSSPRRNGLQFAVIRYMGN